MTGERRPPPWLPWVLCWPHVGVCSSIVGSLAWLLIDRDPVASVLGGVVRAWPVLGFAGPLVGALIAARLPANAVRLAVVRVGLALRGADAAATGSVRSRRGGPVARWVLVGGFVSWRRSASLVFVFLLFPTGRLPSRRWRWLARAAVLAHVPDPAAAVPLVREHADLDGRPAPGRSRGRRPGARLALLSVGATAMFVCVVLAAMASMLVRFRRAGPVERQQLTWFLLAAALAPRRRARRTCWRAAAGPGRGRSSTRTDLRAAPGRGRDRGAAVPALRDRPDREPDGVLRAADRGADRPLSPRGGAAAAAAGATDRQFLAGRGGVDPGGGGGVQPRPAATAGRGGPTVRPGPLRRGPGGATRSPRGCAPRSTWTRSPRACATPSSPRSLPAGWPSGSARPPGTGGPSGEARGGSPAGGSLGAVRCLAGPAGLSATCFRWLIRERGAPTPSTSTGRTGRSRRSGSPASRSSVP